MGGLGPIRGCNYYFMERNIGAECRNETQHYGRLARVPGNINVGQNGHGTTPTTNEDEKEL